MDAGDSVYGVNSVKWSEVCNSNKKGMITKKANGGSGGTPESEIPPSAVKKPYDASTLSGKLSGLDISERNGLGCSECSAQPLEISLKKTTRSAKKLVTPTEENNHMELSIADMPDKGKGHLPSYSINFKCAERAHKRKEFYLKLEEKIRTKEMERSIILAKLKEAEDAEIKMLRKNLVIKAKPLPSFYFEHTPIQMELKKDPARKAKSPEDGRPAPATPTTKPLKLASRDFPSLSARSHSKGLSRGSPPTRTNQSILGNPMHLVKPPPCLAMEHEAGTCQAKEMQDVSKL